MKNLLTISTLIIFTCSLYAQKGSTAKEKNGVQNIVITEKTYKNITKKTLNKRKSSDISDKNSRKPRVADNPLARRLFELEKSKNPATGKIPANIKELEKAYALSARSGLLNKTKSIGLSYTNSGPRNIGGRTRALAIDIADVTGNTILAGGVTGGMWKSTNKGQTWTRTTELDEHPSVTAIAQDLREGHTSTWYYTTGELLGSASIPDALYTGDGVFKSTDNGDTWTKLDATVADVSSFNFCFNVCVDPNNGDVYVATHNGIHISRDGGVSWAHDFKTIDENLEPEEQENSLLTDIICTPAGVKYATFSSDGNRTGVWRKGSEVNATWEDITPAREFPTNYRRMVLAHAPSNTNMDIVYLLAQTPRAGLQGHSFWKLTYNDATATWENRSQNLPEGGVGNSDVDGYNSQNSYNMVVKVAPDNENMVFIGGTNLFRSDDALATQSIPLSDGVTNPSNTYWIGGYATENDIFQYDNHHADIHALVFINNTTLLCGHDGGISLTANAKQIIDSKSGDGRNKPVDWELLNNSYLTTQAYTVAIDHDVIENKFLLAGFQDNGTWLGLDEMTTTDWIHWGSGDGGYASILNKGEFFLSSTQNGKIFLENGTEDSTADYFFARIDPKGAINQLFINPFIVDANNDKIMYYAAGQYVWRNSNIFKIPRFSKSKATKNWERLEISRASGTVSALESSTFPAHILYYGTSSGKIYKLENSHSAAAKATEITGSGMPDGGYVSSIDANPLNADEIIVCFSNYSVESVFYSNDGGISWQAISGNLEDGTVSGDGPSVRSVAIEVSPTGSKTYYAGTSTGLYATSTLNGSSTIWTYEARNKIGTTIVDMVKVRRDGFIAVATHGNGIFTADTDYSSLAPKALIGMTEDTIQRGKSVDFMNRSIGDGITDYAWTFTGAETDSSTDEHPEDIQYNNPGVYDVSLTVTNANESSTQTITGSIVVIEFVKADFSVSETSVNVGEEVQFNNLSGSTSISYTWSFPGGTPESSNETNPRVTYNSVGTYNVTLTVSDGTHTDTKTREGYITVQDPNNDLLYNILPEFEDELTQVLFTGNNDGYLTGHNSLSIDQYAEKFELTNPTFNFVKQVHIRPSVMQSNSADPNITIKIWNGTSEPAEEVYSQVVPFSELTEDEFNIIDLDSSVAVEENFFVGYEISYTTPVDSFAVSHLPLESNGRWNNTVYIHYNDIWRSYSSILPNNSNISLAIKAFVGNDLEDTVVQPFEADFSANETSINVGEEVQFNNLSGSTPTSYIWSFPGGTPDSSDEANPRVTYNSAGTYNVTLTVSNGTHTDTETKEGYITVQNPNNPDDDLLYNILSEFEDELTQALFTGNNDGYLTGHNSLLTDQYAEKFELTNPNFNSVQQVHILPTVMQSNSADPNITIKIWNGISEPTEEVYSQVVPFSELTEGEFNIIDLDFSVAVEENFFVGYEINYTTPVDSFAVAHLPLESNGGWNNTAYIHYNNEWHAYDNIFSENPTSLAIKALAGHDPEATIIQPVEADFSVSETSINVGEEVQFNNLSGSTPTSYTWSFPGGTPDSSDEANPRVTYNSAGTYNVTLTVSDGTHTDTETREGYITVQNPDNPLYNILPEFEDELTQAIFADENEGYLTGHNNLLTDQYAEKFELTNPNFNSVQQIHIRPSVMQSNSADPNITIKIWNGTSEPVEEVYSQVVPFSELSKDEFNIIDLNFPVAVEENFFVGYEISYTTPVDSFAVAHLPLESDRGWNNTAYMHYNNEWYAYDNIFSENPTSLAIKALVGYDAGATGIYNVLTNRKVEKLLIYPNPMVDKAKVEYLNDKNQEYRLIVIDANGVIVRIIENITDNNVTINREQLKPGIHIINLEGEKIHKGKLLVK